MLKLAIPAIFCAPALMAAERPPLVPQRWSGDLNVPDPVACSVDAQGRVFVTRTSRRKTADLDIRQWSEWIPDDVGLTSVAAKSAFLRAKLAPGMLRGPRGDLRDWNGDGSIDWQDLAVPAERILLLEDRDGNGTADHLGEFAGGFASDVTGIAAGVLAINGDVYATIAPDLWLVADRDGDGKAEHREALVHGFGIHLAYAGHDMHGLTRGPDGRIYWTIGDKGVQVQRREDGHIVSFPHEGCVLRCEPDGSRFEVFAHGLRNVQEIAFNEAGDLFGVDNDADKPGEKERLVWILPESDSGWRCSWQYMKDWCPWTSEGRWQTQHGAQPIFLTPPIALSHDGPSGFASNPGTALAPEWNGWFFLNQFPSGHMNALRLVQEGSGWRLAEDVRVSSGIMGVGMSWGPDGALYYTDWESGYELNGKGAVWRADVTSAQRHPLREEVRNLLAAGFKALPEPRLAELLSHADQRIRCGAQWELADRGAWTVLQSAAGQSGQRLAQLHGLWGLGQGWRSGRHADSRILADAMADPDPEIRVAAARVATEASSSTSTDEALVRLLADSSPRVRLAAALACGPRRIKAAVPVLLRLADPELEPFTRHAIVTGLAGCADPAELSALAADPAVSRRAVAVLALARLRHAATAQFLNDSNPRIAEAAAIAIHDGDGIPEALPSLADFLGKARASEPESVLRRALAAQLRSGTAAAATTVAAFALSPDHAIPIRRLALDLLRDWTSPSRLDSADGMARQLPERNAEAARTALQPFVPGLLALEQPVLQAAALDVALAHQLPFPAERLTTALADAALAPATRQAAIRLLAASHGSSPGVLHAITSAIRDKDNGVAITALDSFRHINPAATPAECDRLLRERAPVRLQQAACRILGELKTPEAGHVLGARMSEPSLPAALLLDFREAAGSYPELAPALQKLTAVPDDAPIAVAWRDCLEGGDPAAGRRICLSDVSAGCVACHRFDTNPGSGIGPALHEIGSLRDRAALLESLLNPSATVADGFGIVTATLTDGSVVAGTLAASSETNVTIRLPEGEIRRIERSQIREMPPPVSGMPPMEAILSRRELRDTVAYLSSLKSKQKR
jgi:putative membrane-bound dehydrogenase-like protein